jgi:hypothetical protein
LQKDATSCRPDRYGSCPLPSPVGQRDLQFFAPNDFELAQELPIPAVGLGVFGIVSSHCLVLIHEVWSIPQPMAFPSPTS